MGDFNLNHLVWSGLLAESDLRFKELLVVSKTYRLSLLFLPGTITYEEKISKSTIKLIYSTTLLSNSVIKCDFRDIDHHLDYFPIITIFQIAFLTNANSIPPTNWKKTNLNCLFKTLELDITNSPHLNLLTPGTYDKSKTGLEHQIASFIYSLTKAIDKSTSNTQICSISKSGVNKKCKKTQI